MSRFDFQVPHLFDKLKKSAFIRNTLLVMSGTAIAQLIGFSLSPIISRLFSPSDFGVFGSFNSISGVVAAVATLEYVQAIFLPKEKSDAINLFVISCVSTSVICLLCLMLCMIAPMVVNGLMRTNGVWALVLLIAAIAAAGFNQACQAWCVRAKAFKATSASQVVRSVSANGMQLGFGSYGAGAVGLVVGGVVADMFANISLARMLISDLLALRNRITWRRMKELAWEYRDFPMYAASQNIIWALSQGIPVLLLTYFFGIAVGGAYAFGVRILQAPMGLVLRALRQVLFQKASETHHQGGNLARLYTRTTVALFALVLFPALALFFWAPQLFSLMFGAQWLTAGEFARGLIVWLMFAFCNLPAVLFAQIIRIQHTVLICDVVELAVKILVLAFGGRYLNAFQTVLLFSLTGAARNAILILVVGYAVMNNGGRTSGGQDVKLLDAELAYDHVST